MRRLYWRPPGTSRRVMVVIAFIATAGVMAVERFPSKRQQPWYAEKIAAARLTEQAMRAIKAEKLRLGLRIDPHTDPAASGMIGSAVTPVTSNTGYLSAKRTSANPNFAAVILHLLKQTGVRRGDRVAVGLSGSFPALNVATFAALRTLALQPIVVTSAASSEWGANQEGLMWLDMERVLQEKSLFQFRSVAASRGGMDDTGLGMTEEGRTIIDQTILRSGAELLAPASLSDAIDRRMQIYDRHAGGRPIRAYVNVGGGTASVGTHVGKKQFPSGVNLNPPPAKLALIDSVMLRFAHRGVPVVHLTDIAELARSHGLPVSPESMPKAGESTVFSKREYNRWLAGAAVLVVLTAMLGLIRLDLGVRLLRKQREHSPAELPPMV